MGILNRFKEIMSSNVNALLDKMENPEKMIDQTIRNLEKDLREVKVETATIMAEEARAERVYESCKLDVEKLESYALKALSAGNEADARKFLEQKVSKTAELETLHQAAEVAALNAKRMCSMHTKLVADVEALKAKQSEIKAKFAAAAAQEKMTAKTSNGKNADSSIAAFAKWEEKANLALDKANAMAKLNAPENDHDLEDLMAKYEDSSKPSVDAELELLKASLNK
ncbi:MAG: PspA/IM30 family protein [bacterium]